MKYTHAQQVYHLLTPEEKRKKREQLRARRIASINMLLKWIRTLTDKEIRDWKDQLELDGISQRG